MVVMGGDEGEVETWRGSLVLRLRSGDDGELDKWCRLLVLRLIEW